MQYRPYDMMSQLIITVMDRHCYIAILSEFHQTALKLVFDMTRRH